MKYFKKSIGLIAVFLLLPLLAGCIALPVEDAVLPPPITRVPEPRQMRTRLVERGDVIHFANHPVTHIPIRQEALSFPVAGQRISGIFANVGDEVREGDILAELERPYIWEQLATARWDEEMLLLHITQLAQRHNFALNQAEISGIPVDDSFYLSEHTRLHGELGLVRMRLEHLYNQVDQMIIYAPFDGVVVWTRDIVPVMWSNIGVPVITIADQQQYIFRLVGQMAEIMEVGAEYNITIANQPFPAIVICPEEEGFVPPAQIGTAQPQAFFRLIGYDMPLITPSMFATVLVVFDYALDVLTIPNLNVNIVGDRIFVHMLEDDVLVLRDIQIGLRGNATTEVTYGLQEGDMVVLP